MKKYLIEIKKHGFEAYFTGGYVRDRLLGKECTDIDISTNASIEDLKQIFKQKNYHKNEWCFSFLENDIHIEITPYRKEYEYKDFRHPSMIQKASCIWEDSLRRDFTINALYEDEYGHITDFHSGLEHIKQRKLVCITDADQKLREDPLRILRALRIASIHHLTLDSTLENAVINHKQLLDKVSYFRKKQELEKIFYEGDIEIIRKYELESYFALKKGYQKTETIEKFWKQVDIQKYPFTKEEKRRIHQT